MWHCTKNEKFCATCSNWGGQRTVKGTWAETDSPSVRGKCYANCPGSASPGPSASEGRNCSKYDLWKAIK